MDLMSNEDYESIKADTINNLKDLGVGALYIAEWEKVYNKPESTEDDYEGIELRMLNSILSNNNEFYLEENNNNIYYSIKKEIYRLICTDSKEYSEQRNAFNAYFKNGVGIFAGFLAGKFGIETAALTGFISLVMIGIFKVGRNAWCSCYSEKFEDKKGGNSGGKE